MKSFFAIVYLSVLSLSVYAQQNYPAANISKDLLPYASAIVRNNDVTVEVKDLDNVIYHVKTAITVLNKNGDDFAHMALFYNKSRTIKYIKGVVYDEFGKQTGKFSESDFIDQSVGQNSALTLFEDIRVKHYIPPVNQYPYTIAYEYEMRYKQSLNFDDWIPNKSTTAAVENSSYTFTCKPDFNIRYKEFNIPEKAVTGIDKTGLKTYTWRVNNLKALRPEPFSPNEENYITRVKIESENFEYEGIKGSFNSWAEMGKWYYDKLLTGRQNIPTETVEHIKAITAGITDPKLKAKKIYEYMQGKTRYISVQVGIGGYQPFLAADVDKLGYGDCKALVNYTQALLKAVNIDSYFCLVYGGDRKISMLSDFATMNQANHAILCIPFKNDTTWVECTSQSYPFGYLGTFTDDRTVLACTANGGKLMHTVKYDATINLQTRRATFTVNASGELTGDMTTTFKGTRFTNRNYLVDESAVEQNKIMQRVYNINNFTVQKLDLKQEKWPQPVSTETILFKAADFVTDDNGRLHFSLNPVNRSGIVKSVRNRANDVYINDGYTDEDEISYTLPAGYHPARNTLNIALNKPFGRYTASMVIKDGQLIYKRRLQINDGTYSKDLYQDVVDFYQAVADADRLSVSLVKNN